MALLDDVRNIWTQSDGSITIEDPINFLTDFLRVRDNIAEMPSAAARISEIKAIDNAINKKYVDLRGKVPVNTPSTNQATLSSTGSSSKKMVSFGRVKKVR